MNDPTPHAAIFQVCHRPEHFARIEPGFTALDWTANPCPELREFGVFRHLVAEGLHRRAGVVGAVSKKFAERGKLPGRAFVDWIASDPGHDLYVVNPWPQHVYAYWNVWQRGETVLEPGFTDVARRVFVRAGLPVELVGEERETHGSYSVCSYWAASARFWERYVDWLDRVLAVDWRAEPGGLGGYLLDDQPYARNVPQCGRLPTILERMIAGFAALNPDLSARFFPVTRERCLAACVTDVERTIVETFADTVDAWDAAGGYGAEQRAYFARMSQASSQFFRGYFALRDFPYV